MRKMTVACALLVLTLALAAGFRELWIREKIAAPGAPPSRLFAAANAALPSKGARPRMVLIGDSRMSRWPSASWSERFEIVNRGVGGEPAVVMAGRFRFDALAPAPDAILIQTGMNDIIAASFLPEAEGRELLHRVARTLFELAQEGAAKGAVVGVALIIPPARVELLRLPVWRESVRTMVVEVNAMLRAHQWPPDAVLIDFPSILETDDGGILADAFRLDAVHLDAAAYERLAPVTERTIGEALAARVARRGLSLVGDLTRCSAPINV